MSSQIIKRLAAPWAIEPGWLRVAWGVGTRGKVDAAALAQAKAEWLARKPRAEESGAAIDGTGGTLRVVGNVGVITIDGPLFRHADLFTDISGGCSYDAIWRALEAALVNDRITAILLRVNSPGGEADGVNELAKGIAAAAARKPLWAFADGMCASAAYWLASQASRIVAEETAEIGSIGVRCGILDDSAADAAAGLREIEIISSQSPGKRSRPVDDEVIARVQRRIDDLADIFITSVADGRGVDEETVLAEFGQGDVLIAARAVEAGLVDEVGTFNATLAALAAESLQPTADRAAARAARTRGAAMARTIRPAADAGEPEDKPTTVKCAGCTQPMHGDADHFCKACFEGKSSADHDEPDGDEDEEATALRGFGLLGARRSETRANLAAFAKSVLTLTGATTTAAALGSIQAGVDAQRAERERLAAAAAEEHRKAQEGMAAAISAGLQGGKLTLGRIGEALDFLGVVAEASEVDKVRAALATTTRDASGAEIAAPRTKQAALAAFAAGTWTSRNVAAVNAWLGNKAATAPTQPTAEPASNKDNRFAVARSTATAARASGVEELLDTEGQGAPQNVFSITSKKGA